MVKFDKLIKMLALFRGKAHSQPRQLALSQEGVVQMTVRANLSGLDFSKEGTKTSFWMPTITAVNFDAQLTALATFQASLQGVSLIAYQGRSMDAITVARETNKPADPYAQREAKWLVSYRDTVTEIVYNLEVGGPDLTLLASDGKTMDVTAGAGLTFANDLGVYLQSRAGNPVTFIQALHVGRNN